MKEAMVFHLSIKIKQFSKIELESADEYSSAVARVALKYTDIPVYYTDEKFDWGCSDGR